MTPRRRFIHVDRWTDFQHYKDRDKPGWIKDYTGQHDDYRYMELTAYQRAVLQDIRRSYARTRRQVPDSTAWLTREFHYKVTRQSLQALNHAGFIRFTSRGAVQKRSATSIPETEADTDVKDIAIGKGKLRDLETARKQKTASDEAIAAAVRLAESIGDDPFTLARIQAYAGQLPEAAFHSIRQQLADKGSEIRNPAGYAINALRSMVDEGQYGAGAA